MTWTRASTTAGSRPSLKLGTDSIRRMVVPLMSGGERKQAASLHHGGAEVVAGKVGDGAVVVHIEQSEVGALAGFDGAADGGAPQGRSAVDGRRGPGFGRGEAHATAGDGHDQRQADHGTGA